MNNHYPIYLYGISLYKHIKCFNRVKYLKTIENQTLDTSEINQTAIIRESTIKRGVVNWKDPTTDYT